MNGSLPSLIKFWDAHEKDKDKFAIIAFHNPSKEAEDFAGLDKQLEKYGTLKKWGKNLPFTVILDNSGQTIKDWGIQSYPTTVLIDPEGKIVRYGSVATIARSLKKK
ncbi:hypothetical protein PLCT2_01414 [Planctomycetaceae bacterium]|nr:hypothetical protein PLCT2_01414 [Planctomycetaceae bacterium]